MNSFSKQSLNKSVVKPRNEPQVQYLGRWVNPKLFRAFVYSKDGEEKLAESWIEFQELTSSGLWFETKEGAQESKNDDPKDFNPVVKRGRPKHDSVCSAS